MSEELETSLQQAIETYLGQRLHAIEEQLSQLQTDFGGALTRLRESAANESLSDTPLSASIFAHFQAARAQKLSGASTSSEPSGDLAALKRGVEQIERQQSHGDVLSALLTSTAAFAERVALFVVKNDQTIGWKLCEAGDPANLESIRVALPLSSETLLSQAVRSRSSWSGAPESHPDNRMLIEQLGGSPKNVCAVPLVARGKVVAVLYADSASTDPNAIGFDAIEVLARVAAMAVDLAATRPVQPTTVSEPVATQQAGATVATVATVPETEAQMVQPEATPEVEPSYVPQVEPQIREVFYEPEIIERAPVEPPIFAAEPIAEESAAEPEPEVFAEPTVEPAWPEPVYEPVYENVTVPEFEPTAHETHADTFETPAVAESVSEPVAPPSFESVPEVVAEPEAPPAMVFEPPPPPPPTAPTPSFSPSYASPLGSSRRYGLTEPELPIEVGDEERRLHNDARRFARLLVSEIKLYNESKVRDGRSQMDLYDRLREDIDRSRQMYDKRVAPPVAARHDYFHQELVNTLAEGDPNKLGANYPGALVTVS